jgi:TolA-binding protein
LKTAQIALDRLHNHYRDHPGLTQAIYEVGCTFSNAGQYDKAAQELNQVITTWPNSDYALKSKVGLGLIQFRQGNGQAAEATYQKIMTDYADHPKLAEAIDLMAEGYFDQGVALEKADAKRIGREEYARIVRENRRAEAVKNLYQRAIEKWQIIAHKLPPTAETAQAWYYTGVVYRAYLNDAERAFPYYQKVVETWPNFEQAGTAQAMLPVCYVALVRSGKIAKEEAEPKLEEAYRAVIEKYPDCPLADQAYLGLGRLNFNKGQWDRAALYFGQFLERYPRARQRSLAVVYLGMIYEKSGKPEVGADLYRTFLKITDPNDPRLNQARASLQGKREVEK